MRTQEGNICKITEIGKYLMWGENDETISKKEKVKHSFNIIDLIEEGDYVNGLPVRFIEEGRVDIGQSESYRWIKNNGIKIIVTKKLLEKIEYKVKEEKKQKNY